MGPFSWRHLSDARANAVEYALNERGYLLLRGTTSAPPFATLTVRDGKDGFAPRPIESLGFVWTSAGEDAWALRTRGEPQTMTHVRRYFGALAEQETRGRDVDPRVVLVTIASEVGRVVPDANGYVKAPHAEVGYPGRTGDHDPGDEDRDAIDWESSHGGHSAHGVMQTLIRTAFGVRPDLFQGFEPRQYREVLWRPQNAIACGVAYMQTFPQPVRQDPLATRIMYGAGSVRPSSGNRWGAVIYDELVPAWAVAFWNDLAFVLEGGAEPVRPDPVRPAAASQGVPWGWIAAGLMALTGAAGIATALYTTKGEAA